MGLGDRGWSDRAENYVDGYTSTLNVSTADNIMGIDIKQPVVVYSITLGISQNNASGQFSLVDSSATGDAGTQKFRLTIASAATTDRTGPVHIDFPRGLAFNDGVIVSALTVTGTVSITYKARYA